VQESDFDPFQDRHGLGLDLRDEIAQRL